MASLARFHPDGKRKLENSHQSLVALIDVLEESSGLKSARIPAWQDQPEAIIKILGDFILKMESGVFAAPPTKNVEVVKRGFRDRNSAGVW